MLAISCFTSHEKSPLTELSRRKQNEGDLVHLLLIASPVCRPGFELAAQIQIRRISALSICRHGSMIKFQIEFPSFQWILKVDTTRLAVLNIGNTRQLLLRLNFAEICEYILSGIRWGNYQISR